MRKDFNTIAKALLKDISTAPLRSHQGLKSTLDTIFPPSGPLEKISNGLHHTLAFTIQFYLMFKIGLLGGIVSRPMLDKSEPLNMAGAAASIILATPLGTKLAIQFLESTSYLLKSASGDKQDPFPPFAAFPELSKAMTTPPQP